MQDVILIVEDEDDLARTLEYNLRREGYVVRSARTGRAALELASKDPPPDLVLLDLMLPDIGGVEVCRTLRSFDRTRRVPVIMVTAKAEEIDRVVGFEVGADDYVVKPFSVRELLLRVRAVLRRFRQQENETEGVVCFGRIRVDPPAHRAWVEEEEVLLTALELKLLTTLLERRGRVQTREMLLADVWGITADVTTRTVDTHVKRLRQKLGAAGEYIETVRGVGYRFCDEPGGFAT
jgi:two-component system phosphate regulon response regulator PhoB